MFREYIINSIFCPFFFLVPSAFLPYEMVISPFFDFQNISGRIGGPKSSCHR